ncbi:MAG: hypothetical protein L6R39_004795 [Caloplaca ligustica]|nr:MAG: hypothetical protein L6R39_004795 [Caloplaca ligustica]
MYPVLLFLLLIQSLPSLQVDIKFVWMHNLMRGFFQGRDPVEAACLDIAPGVCCRPHKDVILPAPETLYDYSNSYVSFRGLLAQQMAAGWGSTTPRFEGIACSGTPLVRLFGPTDGQAHAYHPDGLLPAPENMVFAASWIDLRTSVPPDLLASRYLQWQGVKEMVWDAGFWSAAGSTPTKRKREKEQQRLNGWAEKGRVTIATPSRWRYPNLYTINGTEFRDGGDGVFKSGDGRVFNLTSGVIG